VPGPYLSERQWGTVREDYSDNKDSWSYFTHDQARSRAYRWGEDGIAGLGDNKQRPWLAVDHDGGALVHRASRENQHAATSEEPSPS
jgi:hypothetical protein